MHQFFRWHSGPSVIRTLSIRPLELSKLVVTVPLECFFKVCVLLKYNMSGAPDKCMGFNSLNFSIIRAHPGPNEFG